MEERQVTVDGTTYPLAAPFMVIATQNPIEMEGTYPLPEAQRDRFMARISMGYPDPPPSWRCSRRTARRQPAGRRPPGGRRGAGPRAGRPGAGGLRVPRHPAVRRRPGHRHPRVPDLRLGASPRATLHLVRAAKAAAALDDRDHVLPDDVQALAVPVLAHRLLLTAEAQIARRSAEDVVADLLRRVPVPAAARG